MATDPADDAHLAGAGRRAAAVPAGGRTAAPAGARRWPGTLGRRRPAAGRRQRRQRRRGPAPGRRTGRQAARATGMPLSAIALTRGHVSGHRDQQRLRLRRGVRPAGARPRPARRRPAAAVHQRPQPEPARRGARPRREVGLRTLGVDRPGPEPAGRRLRRGAALSRRRTPRSSRSCTWSRCTCCASTSTRTLPGVARSTPTPRAPGGAAAHDAGRSSSSATSLLDRDVDGTVRPDRARTRRRRCSTRRRPWTGRAAPAWPRCSPPGRPRRRAGHRARRRRRPAPGSASC